MKSKEKENGKTKKPLYKKWWFWLIVVVLVGGIGTGRSGGEESTEPSSVVQVEAQAPASSSELSESAADGIPDASVQERRVELENALGGSVLFYDNVRNDTTGRWRVLVFYSAENILDHAVEYYDAYFSSDDEVHMAVNLGLKTTGVMTVSSGLMSIRIHEYVDGEEHDANTLGSGDLLKQYMVDLKTGAIDDLDYVSANDGGSISLSGLEAAISAALPDEYQGSRWLDVDCAYNDAGISVYMQVDQGNSDTNAALSLAADCFALAKNATADNNATLVQVVVTVVNDGAAVGVYSTENGKNYTVLSGGKRTEVSLP